MAGVPFIFGNATTSIPLSNLDANFNTGLTIGNTTVGLGNTVTTLGNVTIANATTISAAGNVFLATSSGSVGIGTTSPAANLDVSSSGATLASISTTGVSPGVGLKLIGATATYKNWLIGSSYAVTAGALEFIPSTTVGGSTFTTPAMTLDPSGNLLVGKTSIATNIAGTMIQPSGNGANVPFACLSGASTNASDTSWATYSTTGATYKFYVDYAGTVHATSVVITAISDERLKENVRDIDTGLDSIMSLKPRRFDWKEGKGQDKKNVAGFIAQEFETVFPECVGLSKAGGDEIEYKDINHETLIPTLVKAIQEQQTLITTLQEQVTALQAKVGV